MTARPLPRACGRSSMVALVFVLFVAIAVGGLAVPAADASSPAAAAAARRAGMNITERAVVRIVNRIRTQRGLSRLAPDRGLTRAADYHSAEMLRHRYFAHASWNSRIHRFVRAREVGEVLAWLRPRHARRRHGPRGAYREALAVVRMWMNSPTHRAVLLTGYLRRIGVGRRLGRFEGARRALVYTADFASGH